ncbi:hypothetical protein U8335_09500 [Roseiconus lacunae]|uniref:hypothetical protein n=1 Tax=Roseiconus lacunae TaxID=2605694 RepID=UPI00308FB052|nr:hypothetical protein U8335_09500 [Stieleria sp. HD01]
MRRRSSIEEECFLTQYEFRCQSCDASLRANPKLAGRTLACPKCETEIVVPSPIQASTAGTKAIKKGPPPATDKQKAYATQLGIEYPDDIDIRAMSQLIDEAQLRQEDERYERLDELQKKESDVREQLRAEILSECDEEDARLSVATKEQMLDELDERDIGAILITLDYGELTDLEDLSGVKLAISNTDNLEADDVKAVLTWLGMAMLRR